MPENRESLICPPLSTPALTSKHWRFAKWTPLCLCLPATLTAHCQVKSCPHSASCIRKSLGCLGLHPYPKNSGVRTPFCVSAHIPAVNTNLKCQYSKSPGRSKAVFFIYVVWRLLDVFFLYLSALQCPNYWWLTGSIYEPSPNCCFTLYSFSRQNDRIKQTSTETTCVLLCNESDHAKKEVILLKFCL